MGAYGDVIEQLDATVGTLMDGLQPERAEEMELRLQALLEQ